MTDNRDQPFTAVLRPTEAAPVGSDDWEKALRRIIKLEIRKALPAAIEEATRRLGHDEEIAGLIHLLAARSNDAKDEVLRKALTLYGLALDAREKGNRLAVLAPDDEILRDVVGFDSIANQE